MLPLWLHQAAEERRLRASDAEFERVVGMGMGPLDTGTEDQEVGRWINRLHCFMLAGAQPALSQSFCMQFSL